MAGTVMDTATMAELQALAERLQDIREDMEERKRQLVEEDQELGGLRVEVRLLQADLEEARAKALQAVTRAADDAGGHVERLLMITGGLRDAEDRMKHAVVAVLTADPDYTGKMVEHATTTGVMLDGMQGWMRQWAAAAARAEIAKVVMADLEDQARQQLISSDLEYQRAMADLLSSQQAMHAVQQVLDMMYQDRGANMLKEDDPQGMWTVTWGKQPERWSGPSPAKLAPVPALRALLGITQEAGDLPSAKPALKAPRG